MTTHSLWECALLFLSTGAFTFGGGYAMIPLLSSALVPGYLSADDMAGLVALAQMTPGPVGLNTATYIGFTQFSYLGAVVCTAALAFPGFCFSLIASTLKQAFQQSWIVKACLKGIRPIVVGLVGAVALFFAEKSVFTESIQQAWKSHRILPSVSWQALVIFAVTILIQSRWKINVFWTMALAAILGILLF